MSWFRFDWHTPIHIFGSYFLMSATLHFATANMFIAGLVTLLFGVGWEILDELNAGVWIFDPRGGDFGDIAADIVGILLRVIV